MCNVVIFLRWSKCLQFTVFDWQLLGRFPRATYVRKKVFRNLDLEEIYRRNFANNDGCYRVQVLLFLPPSETNSSRVEGAI
jgi:hypothetical protein